MNWLSYIGFFVVIASFAYIVWQLIMKFIGKLKHNNSHKGFKKIGISLIFLIIGFALVSTYKETKADIAADKKEARIESSKKASEKEASKNARSKRKVKAEEEKHANSVSESKAKAKSASKDESSKKVKAKKESKAKIASEKRAKDKKASRAESKAKKESKINAKKESKAAKSARSASKKAEKASLKKAKNKQIQKNFTDYKTFLSTVPSKTKNAITDAYLDNTSEVTVFVLNDDAMSLNSNSLKTVARSAWNTGNRIVGNYTPFPSKYENYERITIEDSAGNRIAHTSLFGGFKFDAD